MAKQPVKKPAANPKGQGKGVTSRHRDYDAYFGKWKRCRDVVSGQDAIYAGRVLYLPALKDEEETEYLARMHRTPFFNATWRTVAGFVGMLFRKPPTIEVPDKVKPLLEDVTMSGVSFEALAKSCAYEDLITSRLGILVDHPKEVVKEDGTRPTVAEAEALALRPVMLLYKAEAIIDWKHSYINNKFTLTQVRLVEEVPEDVNEFQQEHKKRVKVLDLNGGFYRIRVYDYDTEALIEPEVYPTMNGKKLTEIPFYFIGPDSTEATVEDPVLIDLVDLNLKHYQVSADYEHGCHFTGLPTPWIAGYQKEVDLATGQPKDATFYIGSTEAWVFPNSDAKAEFLEFTGTGLTALEKNLDRKEAQMAAIGARMLAPEKSGVEAADTLAMRHSGEHSILAAIAIAVSEGLTKALKTFCEWAGYKGEVKFDINRDFIPIIADAALLTKLISLMQAGKLDDESLFNWLKRVDLLDHELSFADWQQRIDDMEPPAPVAAPAAPGQPKPAPKPAPKADE